MSDIVKLHNKQIPPKVLNSGESCTIKKIPSKLQNGRDFSKKSIFFQFFAQKKSFPLSTSSQISIRLCSHPLARSVNFGEFCTTRNTVKKLSKFTAKYFYEIFVIYRKTFFENYETVISFRKTKKYTINLNHSQTSK